MKSSEKVKIDQGIYRRSIQGGKWFMINAIGQKVINLITFFVLARILVPEDYGLIAIVLMVTALIDQVTSPSFGDALLQRKDSMEPYLDIYWTFEVLRSFVILIFFMLFGGFLGAFFNMPLTSIWLMRLAGLLVFVPALSNIRQIYFIRDLDFKTLLIRDWLGRIAFGVGTVVFALFFQASAWALFVGNLIQGVVSLFLSYTLYLSLPSFRFQFYRLKDLIAYSKWVYAQSFFGLLFSQLDKLTVGYLLQPAQLGIYSKGKDLSSMATTMTMSMVRKVGLSAFSKVQDQMNKVQAGFVKSIDLVILFSLPVTLLVLVEGESIVSILLGSRWMGIVVPLKIFAFGNIFLAFSGMVNPVLGALGRPDINFKVSAFQAMLSIPLMFIGMHYYGLNGLAMGVVSTWFCVLFYVMYVTRPILRVGKKMFLPSVTCGVLAVIIVIGTDILLRLLHLSIDDRISGFARSCVLGVMYFLTVYVVSKRFSHGPWQTFVSILKELH